MSSAVKVFLRARPTAGAAESFRCAADPDASVVARAFPSSASRERRRRSRPHLLLL